MTKTKKYLTTVLMALVFLLSVFYMPNFFRSSTQATADTESTAIDSYFYNNLTTQNANGTRTEYTLAKKFYAALEQLNTSGVFKTGKVSYEINNIVTSAQIKDWVNNGNLEVPKAFSAARDAFLMDHPELFYIDLYKLTISASLSGGTYSAYIDTGREATAFRDQTFRTTAEVESAIATFDSTVQSIANQARTAAANNKSEIGEDLKLALAVNERIASLVKYDFGTLNSAASGTEMNVANMTFSAYGALVLKSAVCSGFSAGYKAVLDYLDIPCIMVSGYSKGRDDRGTDTGNTVGHSWNYVWLETTAKSTTETHPLSTQEKTGEWFAFDTTWNSLSGDRNKHSAMNAYAASREHVPDGVISSSGYSLTYPALSGSDYREATNPNKMHKDVVDGDFTYSIRSTYNAGYDNYSIFEYVNYNGKNASGLVADDIRIVTRQQYMDHETGELKWTYWQDIANSLPYHELGIQDYSKGATNLVGEELTEDCSVLFINSNTYVTQFAIIEGLAPDLDVTQPNTQITWPKISYSDIDEMNKHMIYISQLFENPAYGTYTPAPYVVNSKTTPYLGSGVVINDSMAASEDNAIMADNKAIEIRIVYDEPLHILDDTQPIGIEYVAEHENVRDYAGFVAFSDGAYVHLVADSNNVLNTLVFKFKPSLMYEHDMEGYAFLFQNVGSAKIVQKKVNGSLVTTTSDKAPNHGYFKFARIYIACPNVFGDGRLWVDCCARPTLVDNSDLSAMNFMDESGNNTFSDTLRSQMMLVANKVTPATEQTMLNEIAAADNNIRKNDIVASETYDINLQICGKYKTIPDGSYVKIALAFPEGYGPNDAGVTFKLFHRKHIQGNEYIIEEVPCVVTKFGIVATVTSFSPYTVAVVPKDKVTTKTIFASIDGKGGKLSLEDGKIRSLESGESYEYTITPDSGYQVHKVTLNGTDVTERISAGKLTVTYDELKNNNELEIQYIATESAERFATNNIIDTAKVVLYADGQTNMYDYDTDGAPASHINTTLVYIFAVLSVIFLGVVIWLVIRYKKSTNK